MTYGRSIRRYAIGAISLVAMLVATVAAAIAMREAAWEPAVRSAIPAIPADQQDRSEPYDPAAPTRTGSGRWRHSSHGRRVELQWTGSFRLAEGERSIAWIEPGHTVRLTDGARWFATGVEIVAAADGTLERHHFQGGFEKPFEPEGRLFMESALAHLVLHAGLAAPARVHRLLQQGGPPAVRAEIARFESDSVTRLYTRELIRQADLPPAEIVAIVRDAAATMRSDSQVSSLVTFAAPAVAGSDADLTSLIAVTKVIDSDSYQARALRELLPDQPSPAVTEAVLVAAAAVGSDSYRYRVLDAVAARGGLLAETRPAFFALVNGMSSSSYRGRLLRSVSAAEGVQPVTVAAVLEASQVIGSDSERRRVVAATMGDRVDAATAPEVLRAVVAIESSSERAGLLRDFVRKGGLSAGTAEAFFALVASMSSSSYQRRVMDDVSELPSLPAPVVSGFLEAAASIASDSDRARVLIAFVERHLPRGPDRERYLVAADGIGSETYQNRVLAALVRAERAAR